MTKEIVRYIIRPEDVLTEQEYLLLQKAQAGELPCPWCEQPLLGSFTKCFFLNDDGQPHYGIRLQCACGFESW